MHITKEMLVRYTIRKTILILNIIKTMLGIKGFGQTEKIN